MAKTAMNPDSTEQNGRNWSLPTLWVRTLVAEDVITDKDNIRPSHTDDDKPSWAVWVDLGKIANRQKVANIMESDLIYLVRIDAHDDGMVALCDIPRQYHD